MKVNVGFAGGPSQCWVKSALVCGWSKVERYWYIFNIDL